eukprot:TRINITY_DN27606_c0_g1_i1.p1 TRINITY_DN27606_c0_g1~~TRINITY_DN27606_c0_g1_i1.p1  ORF type:complete len:1059 (+),score=256.78 TRINITY_DN27606_c0_g1_i1:126-3302(+)
MADGRPRQQRRRWGLATACAIGAVLLNRTSLNGAHWRAWLLPRSVGEHAPPTHTGSRSHAVEFRRPALPGRASRTALAAAETALIPTAEAPFLTPPSQPLILSPDGLRTVRFEFGDGCLLRVESAPAFGEAGSVTAAATKSDVDDRVRVIPYEKLSTQRVRDLFWLDDRLFLATGTEGDSGRFVGWIADLKKDTANLVSMPSRDSSLFVPVGMDGHPIFRVGSKGEPEVLLGFKTVNWDGQTKRQWSWYNIALGDLEGADESEDLPSNEWREVVVNNGLVEAVLAVNGTVFRKGPSGWLNVGTIQVVAEEGPTALDELQTIYPRQYLIGTGPEYSVYALDWLGEDAPEPQTVPPLEHLAGQVAASSGNLAQWVLQQCQEKKTTALVQMVSPEAPPTPLFAHPFADVTAFGIWVDPEDGQPGAVMVEDLRPHVYSLTNSYGKLLASLKEKVPAEVSFGDVQFDGSDLYPLLAERHGNRWLVSYWHPSLTEVVALPAYVEGDEAQWVGGVVLPARGGALSAAPIALNPLVQGARIPVAGEEVPLNLLQPDGDSTPAALVVRVEHGQQERDAWGADGVDAWLLSRNYAVLKVNYRGSSGFGKAWASKDAAGAFEDVVGAVRWALETKRVLGGVQKPAVAIMGSYLGGFMALQAMLRETDLFSCAVAVAPTASTVTELKETAKGLGAADDLPLMIVEFERDAPESRGHLLPELVPAGATPDEWPSKLRFVEYAGEQPGGGLVRQNSLDRYRRLDNFLYTHLGGGRKKSAGGDSEEQAEKAEAETSSSTQEQAQGLRGLLLDTGRGVAAAKPQKAGPALKPLRETFVDEIPFISASVLPAQMKGRLSAFGKDFELGLVQELRFQDAELADRLPSVTSDDTVVGGFASGSSKKSGGKRSPLLAPRHRISVPTETRGEGAVAITLVFDSDPTDLHVILTDVWAHVRANGMGFNLALPRQPLHNRPMKVSRLPTPGSFVIEIQANNGVGALENYNAWANPSTGGGGGLEILATLTPEQFLDAPVVLPMDEDEVSVDEVIANELPVEEVSATDRPKDAVTSDAVIDV